MARKTTQRERATIYDLLKEHLTSPDSDGHVSYLNGMSDAKIAELVPGVVPQSVAYTRSEIFGKLRRARQKPANGLEERLASFEARLAKLEASLGL